MSLEVRLSTLGQTSDPILAYHSVEELSDVFKIKDDDDYYIIYIEYCRSSLEPFLLSAQAMQGEIFCL